MEGKTAKRQGLCIVGAMAAASLAGILAYSASQSIEPADVPKHNAETSRAAYSPVAHNYNFITLDHLIVNSARDSRVVVFKDEESGIQDLRKLADTSNFEVAYAYLSSEKKWVEIGKSNLTNSLASMVNPLEQGNSGITAIDNQLVSELIGKYSEIVLYHIHPNGDNVVRQHIKERKVHGKDLETARKELSVYLALPSIADFKSCQKQLSEFNRKNPNGRIAFNIISPLGITVYGWKTKGLLDYMITGNIPTGSLDETFKKFRVHSNEYFGPVEKANKMITGIYSSSPFSVKLTPY